MKTHFFLAGAQKCGTSSLHYYLSKHPKICMGKTKEIHYYSIDKNYNKGLDWYKRNYNNCEQKQITGDASPLYIYLKKVPERIYNDFPKAKFIFILRNPVERAWSHYSWQVRMGIEYLSFEKAIVRENKRINKSFYKKRKFSYTDRGKYFEQIKRFLDFFSKDQMLFIFSKELKNNPNQVINKICHFLDINTLNLKNQKNKSINRNKIPKSRIISFLVHNSFLIKNKYISGLNQKYNLKPNNKYMAKETERSLKNYFEPYNQELKKFLDLKELNW